MVQLLFRFLGGSAVIFGMCVILVCPALAADVVYTGNSSDLKTASFGGANNTPGSVFAGSDNFPLASGNTVTINFSSGTSPYRVFGGLSDISAVTGNTVTLTSGAITNSVFGGWTSGTGQNAYGNSVYINGTGVHAYNIIGGYSDNGDALHNHVGMASGTVNGIWAGDGVGNHAYNSVLMSGGNVSNGINAAYSASGTLSFNTVTMTGGTVGTNIWGSSGGGDVHDNSVAISGGTVEQRIYGAYSGSGNARNNSVAISGATTEIGINVLGAYAGNGIASGNSVIMNEGWVKGNIWGAQNSGSGAASGNTVQIDGGKIGTDGNSTTGQVHGGHNTSTGEVSNNSVAMSGGHVLYDILGGRCKDGDAKNNEVRITGGSVGGAVVGGWAVNGAGNVINNSVIIEGGKIDLAIYGGWAADGGDATGNTLTISGGTDLTGISGGRSDLGDATGNAVYISGGNFSPGSMIAGGQVGSGDATNNSVYLSGNPDLSTIFLKGGHAHAPGMGDIVTGNTLYIQGFSGRVAEVNNFENYHFDLIPATGPVLEITGATPTNLSGANITVGALASGKALAPGDTLTLISKTINTPTSFSGAGIPQGISLMYDVTMDASGNILRLVVDSVSVKPEVKALSEGRLAGLAFINQGGDLLAGKGIYAARNAGDGFGTFFAAQGGTSRYDTGSHVDLDGFSLMTGIGWNTETRHGKLLLGAFFETGSGNYDSHNSFNGYASVKGNGDTRYYGGGILSRFDFIDTGSGNVYAEASFRAGWSETDFSSDDLREGITGQTATYDSGSAYYGMHLGLGYAWRLSAASSLDLYTKYFWTHQERDSVTVLGDPVTFKSADSHRWRGGVRYSHSLTTGSGLISPYIGAAYEHEFDGKASATTYGYPINAPNMKGGTGIGELGLSFKPSADSGFSVDLGAQGYTGKHEGVGGSLQFRWEF